MSNNHNAYERRKSNAGPMHFAGLSLPVEESTGQCSECGKDGTIFTETGRCKECEIREIAKCLAAEMKP